VGAVRSAVRAPIQADVQRLAREQADLAMAWLSKAVAAGLTDVAQVKNDTDLDALREQEELRKLLAELETKEREKMTCEGVSYPAFNSWIVERSS
jgi:hypothetical protein